MSKSSEYSDFAQWIRNNNGRIHDSIQFSHTLSTGTAMITTAPIAANQRLLSCPHAVVIDCKKAAAGLPTGFSAAVSSCILLRFFLCRERLAGTDSFWYPYLRLLPEKFDTPAFFNDQDWTFLAGTNLAAQRRHAEAEAEQQWGTGIAALKDCGIAMGGYTRELYLWASAVFSSRAFPGKLMLGEDDDNPALFPLIDFLNHRPRARIVWQPTPQALEVLSVDGMEEGVQVYNNYGPKGNEELLSGYGFTVADNPADTVALRLAPPILSAKQAAIRARQPQPLLPDVYHLTAQSPHLPETLTSLFHLITASSSDLELLFKNPCSPSIRNELMAYSHLHHALKHKLQPLQLPLPAVPETPAQRAAEIYRTGQRAILEAARAECQLLICMLLACYSDTLITLESALGDKLFADAVERTFGSCDVTELEQAGHDDLVFVLYLCWKASAGDQWAVDVDKDTQVTFDDLFPAAAESAPEVFGGDLWTAETLARGMAVYRNQGILVNLTTPRGDKALYIVPLPQVVEELGKQ